jgi:ABC-2 type transport system permease protein
VLPRIVRHEWRNLVADRTLGWVAALFAVIVGYGVWNGAAWARSQQREAREARAAYDKRIAELRAELQKPPLPVADPFAPDPRAARTVGSVRQDAFLPPTPLAALSVGQADVLPGKVGVSVWTARRMLTRNYEVQNPLNLLAGRFDLAFAVVYLFPLLILALSYNLLSAERDQGTLALLLSQPVALATFVWGKVASRFLVVVALGLGLSLLGILLAGAELGRPGAWPRLGLWVVVVLLYGAFWFSVAVLVSAFGRSSPANAVALAAAWLALVIVVPSLVGLAASSIHPVPSRALLVHAMRQASNEADQKGSKLLEKYFQDHPELVPGGKPDFTDFTTRYLTTEQEIDAAVAPVLERYDRALLAQQAFVSRLRALSPAISVQEALNDIAGTGLARHRLFLDQAWAFTRATKDFFVPRIFRKETLGVADYDALPQFAFAEEPAGAVARRVAPGLAWTLAPTLLLGWLGMSALRRYPVAG